MNEEIIALGETHIIRGILTKAEGSSANSNQSKPLVLITNAGFLHRVGPYRQWVDLARHLCSDGICTFRFDCSGLGDSDMRQDDLPEEVRPVRDVIKVMDYFEENHGIKRFVIIGLCSGADYGHAVAVADDRVIGTFFIDSFGYRTSGWYVHHYMKRFKSLFNLKKISKGILKLWRKLKPASESKNLVSKTFDPDFMPVNMYNYIRTFPPQENVEAELIKLVDRNVDMFFVFTSGVDIYINHLEQFYSMYPKLNCKNKIQVEFYQASDHTFSILAHRKWLQDRIRHWLQRY